jgi:hypothetical protein
MPILELKAKVGLDGRGFKAGMRELESATNHFAGSVRAQLAAAFSVAAATGFLRNISETVSRIKDLSDQYGITTDEVQKADVALKKNGLQFENLGHSMQRISSARREAVEGNAELRASFERYGVTLNDLNNPQKRNYDLILQIADAIKGQNLTARDQIEITDLLGARSLKLITTLQTLKDFEGIELFRERDIEIIDEASKKLDEMLRKAKVLAAAGVVEASRSPARFIADYISELPPTAPVPAFLSLAGKLFGKFQDQNLKPTGALTPLDVVLANQEKAKRIGKGKATDESGLFEVDKEKKIRAASEARFDVDRPSGFGSGGGLSRGFLNAFDPRMVVEQGQLDALISIRSDVSAIKNNMTPGSNSDP